MKKSKEGDLYPQVAEWLRGYLKGRHPRARISAYDTHKTELSNFLRTHGLHKHFPDFSAYEIQVDVTAVVERKNTVDLAFVECKMGAITLRDVGQLLGYSLVARPELSFLLSPKGLSDRLATLLLTFGRQDILGYGENRMIRLAAWDLLRREINLSSLVPKGSHN